MAFNFPAFSYIVALIIDAFLIFFSIFHVIAFDELKTDYKNPIDQCNSLNPVIQPCCHSPLGPKLPIDILTLVALLLICPPPPFLARPAGVRAAYTVQFAVPVFGRMAIARPKHTAHRVPYMEVVCGGCFLSWAALWSPAFVCLMCLSLCVCVFRYANRPVMSQPGLYDPTSIMNTDVLRACLREGWIKLAVYLLSFFYYLYG